MKMRYDQDDDVLMIWFDTDKKVYTAEQSGNSILHLTQQGEPVLLEILSARAFVVDLVRTALSPSEAAAD